MFKSNQCGGIFGLDARVALIIFTVLTLVSGYTGIKAYSTLKAQGFAAEIKVVAKGTAQAEVDLGMSLYSAVTHACLVGSNPVKAACRARHAFAALYDVTDLDVEGMASRWHGPYITPQDLTPKYGTGSLFRGDETGFGTLNCVGGTSCYNWLEWTAVPLNEKALENINNVFDGSSEITPAENGIFQWSDNGDGTYTVTCRLSRSI